MVTLALVSTNDKRSPGAAVHLRATHVADGWIAAFCDSWVCSPGQVRETMPSSGTVVLQFELIREEDSAPKKSGAVIETDGGRSVNVPSNAVSRIGMLGSSAGLKFQAEFEGFDGSRALRRV